MAITQPAVRAVWASSAPTSGITDPDSVTPGYSALGWPLSTQPPSRQFFNWVFNFVTNAVQYFSRRGVSDWQASQTYQLNDVALGSNGVLYQSLVSTNAGNNPTSTPSKWGGLNGYALSSVLAGYVTNAQLAVALVPYDTIAARNTALASYVTDAALMAGYYTQDQTVALLVEYEGAAIQASEAYVNAQGFDTTAARNLALQSYVTLLALEASYATFAWVQDNFYSDAQADAMFDTITDVNNKLANYAPLSAFANGNNGNIYDGYYRLPNGLIEQYGTIAGISGSGTSIPFPLQFPNACLNVTASSFGANGDCTVLSFTKSAVTIVSGGGTVSWRATGY